MAAIHTVTLEVDDPAAAEAFYATAFGLGDKLKVTASQAPTAGFRGFAVSLVVSQPSTVDSYLGTALDAGAKTLKRGKKGFWGYGGVVQSPDGAISHRIVIGSDAGTFTDPDGFAWESTSQTETI